MGGSVVAFVFFKEFLIKLIGIANILRSALFIVDFHFKREFEVRGEEERSCSF